MTPTNDPQCTLPIGLDENGLPQPMLSSISRRKRLAAALVSLCGLLTLVLSPGAAIASTTVTTTFGVSAMVQATCIVSATSLAFGTYTGLQATATSTVSVTCTNTTPYNVGLSAGTTGGATVTARQLSGPSSAVLNYSLFSDSGRTVNWGTTVGTDTVSGTGNGSAQSITVYGQVGAGQYASPGSYTDTITATVTY